MSNQWIRLYREALHDPKIVTLSDRQHRAWFNMLLMADDDGYLPHLRDIICHLRATSSDAVQLLNELVECGLVDVIRDVAKGGAAPRFRMHGWEARQYRSDNSTERVKKHRAKTRNANETFQKRAADVAVTPPEPETDTETDSEPEQTRERAKGFEIGNVTGSEVREVEAELIRRAEGLGLNARAIEGDCYGPTVKNPSAYFQSLVRKRLKAKLPGISDDVIGRGLCGDNAAYGTLMNLIVMAEST